MIRSCVPKGTPAIATVCPAVGIAPLAVAFPAVPQHCAQLQYPVSIKFPRYFPWLEEPESEELLSELSEDVSSADEVSADISSEVLLSSAPDVSSVASEDSELLSSVEISSASVVASSELSPSSAASVSSV